MMNDRNDGHAGNGNGQIKSPSEKAWETAREQAREQGRTVRDEEIRVIKNKALSCWAKLLFWILTKICWESSPFLHGRRIGSVCITGRQLELHFHFPQKRLYAQARRQRAIGGKVIATNTTPGAIEELETLGVIWLSRKRIENIPANKWPNVFNLTALVPQVTQESLGLLEGVYLAEDDVAGTHATDGGSSVFFASNGRGSGQTPQKGPASNGVAPLAATAGRACQAPHAVVAKPDLPELPTPQRRSSAATDGGSSQAPNAVAAKPRTPEWPTPAGGTPIKTVRLNSDSLTFQTGGEAPPPAEKDVLADYRAQWQGPPGHPTHRSKLEKELGRLKVKMQGTSGDLAAFWQARLNIIREILDAGKPPSPAPARSPQVKAAAKAKPMSEAQMRSLWAAEKRQLALGGKR